MSPRYASFAVTPLAGLLAAACALPPAPGAGSEPTGDHAPTATAIAKDDIAPEEPSAREALCQRAPGQARGEQVCWRWRCEASAAAEPARWGGDPLRCDAGSLDPDASERALRALAVRRFLADVPPVELVPSWTDAAQRCALVAHANQRLSHTPTPGWQCWSDTAALASSVSLIANRSAPPSIAAFFEDPGNESTMVHRRWLLSEELNAVGLGSTDRYACVVVDGRSLDDPGPSVNRDAATKRGWVAWPPAGPVPLELFAVERLDTVGWTIQSDDDDLDRATVTVTRDGAEVPIRQAHLAPGMGSRSAIRFAPDGWTTEAGRRYAVEVRGAARSIDFTVEPLDCP